MKKPISTAAWLLTGCSLAGCVPPAQINSLERRVAQLEQRLSNEGLYDMHSQIQQLQTEVQQLRGDAEGLNHNLEAIKKQQKDQYLDLDRRLSALEGRRPAQRVPDSQDDPFSSTDPYSEGRTELPDEVRSDSSPDFVGGQPGGRVSEELYTDQPPVERPYSAPSAASATSEQAAYDNVFETMKQGRYDAAVEQFNEFLVVYPNGEYADNARYWLAEAYYVTRDFPSAQAGFQRVLNDHPQSAKAPDALLKMGYIAYEQGQSVEARKTLYEVIERYPNSNAARLAEKRLTRMKEETP